MENISITSDNKLVFYVDRGLEETKEVKGKFQVLSEDGEVENFTGIYKAIFYYFNLEKSAKLWSLTNQPILFHEKLVFQEWRLLEETNQLCLRGKI